METLTAGMDMDLELSQWIVLCVCASLITLAKTGLPGLGILVVPLLADFFPAKASTGLLLPILAFADIFAVSYYRRHAQWKHILRLLPWALVGICIGSFLVMRIPDARFKPLIGIVVLIMLALNYWRNRFDLAKVPTHWTFAATMGLLAGVTTQLANAAGPIMIIYLLTMRFDKHKFIGTSAWYFLILNWLKIPIFVYEGRITLDSFVTDLYMIPVIAVSSLLGLFILKNIPQKWFNTTIQILALLAAIKLLASMI